MKVLPLIALITLGLGATTARAQSPAELTLGSIVLRGDGKMAVGTTNFGQDASASLLVNGKIVAKEVEVKNVAADYVFEPGYRLRPLSEVEEYIKANHHLPDIPAASVTEKGVRLAEFNTLLLQKIEELTLYVLQQQREIETLKKRNRRSRD